jgi:hypothetical protein
MPMNTPGKEMVQATTHTLAPRMAALDQLGRVMAALGAAQPWPGHASGLAEVEYNELDRAVREARIANGWATEENVRHAFSAWAKALQADSIAAWLAAYPALEQQRTAVKTVGLILAGNVPLVGLHDVLCVWLSGHQARVKCSSQEPALIPALLKVLDTFLPGTLEQIVFTGEKLGTVDAVIATGSNNTARYFHHYFGQLPRIVRKSRVSVAVLDGSETEDELAALAEDVFRYYGLGCRNVAKVYVPQDFDLDRIFGAFFPWKDIVHHNKYGNNYDYTRALWMLDGVPFLENGFVLFREDTALQSPAATLHYERYTDRATVDADLAAHAEDIQCIVGHGAVPFGQAQQPGLADYADGVDTLGFLLGEV